MLTYCACVCFAGLDQFVVDMKFLIQVAQQHTCPSEVLSLSHTQLAAHIYVLKAHTHTQQINGRVHTPSPPRFFFFLLAGPKRCISVHCGNCPKSCPVLLQVSRFYPVSCDEGIYYYYYYCPALFYIIFIYLYKKLALSHCVGSFHFI